MRTTALRMLVAAAGLCALLALPANAGAAVWTNQSDYLPGSTVTISGDNSDAAGYQAGEQVVVAVSEPAGTNTSCEATTDFTGAWSCQITLASTSSAIGTYSYTAEGQISHVAQSGSFTDSNCPDASSLPAHTKKNKQIKASYTVSGGTATYSFTSPNDAPVKGIPGLLEYCVYTVPQPAEPPDGKSVEAIYGDWTVTEGGSEVEKGGHGYFNFERKGGTSDNVPFDGTTQTMGTATWSSGKVPANQVILCHINDPGSGKEDSFVRCLGPEAAAPTATKTAKPAFTRKYAWGIEKSVNTNKITTSGPAAFEYTVSVTHDAGTDSAWKVSGEITVNNPNSATVSGVNVTDAINDANATCIVTGGTNATLAAGANKFPYSCTYSAAPKASKETNTATVKWGEQELSNKDVLEEGQTTGEAAVNWSNPTIVDGSVSVGDTLAGPLGTVSYTDPSPTTFAYEHTFSGDPAGECTSHENTATSTTDTTKTIASASKSVEVCVPEQTAKIALGPTASKTAEPQFARTYAWGIEKSVNTNKITTTGGATFKYTVTVTHDSGTDSGWKVKGVISVSNANSAAITGVNVTDAINDAHASCEVTGGTNATLPAESPSEFEYSCSYSAAPEASKETNTAKVEWGTQMLANNSTLNAGSTTAKASVDWSATTPEVIDGSDSVTDTMGGLLGTVSYTDPSPTAFTYEHTFSGDPVGTCTVHENTATSTTGTTATKHSASQSVEVCDPCYTVVGNGHFGPKTSKQGENLNNNLSSCPGAKQQFASTWNNGTEKMHVATLTSVSVVINGKEKKFIGQGTAVVNGVKGYEISFTFTQFGVREWNVDFTISKAGVPVFVFNLDPLNKTATSPSEKFTEIV